MLLTLNKTNVAMHACASWSQRKGQLCDELVLNRFSSKLREKIVRLRISCDNPRTWFSKIQGLIIAVFSKAQGWKTGGIQSAQVQYKTWTILASSSNWFYSPIYVLRAFSPQEWPHLMIIFSLLIQIAKLKVTETRSPQTYASRVFVPCHKLLK